MYYINPLNLPYKYQFFPKDGTYAVNREAADPSLVLFKGVYYLFPSMTAGFYASVDLVHWKLYEFYGEIPIYDYAPDVRVVGDYLYFCASKRGEVCPFFRTTDPINGTFERIEGTFDFWDPNLFCDEDGRLYLYWGCSNNAPIFGVELDKDTMHPIGTPSELIFGKPEVIGYERTGDEHVPPKTPEMIEAAAEAVAQEWYGKPLSELPAEQAKSLRAAMGNAPYIEGAWMTKHNGVYYLQYAAPGTEYNGYGDGVYTSKSPLGPFTLAKNNPFSYKPGGFMAGAGHGSTFEDTTGGLHHISTMVISKNHTFERRLGIWSAGFDADGEMFCDTRFGDWVQNTKQKPWQKPEWMLLSYGMNVTVSSGTGAQNVTDENVKTWWRAADNTSGQWVQVDLGCERDVRGIQINFADDGPAANLPDGATLTDNRYIDRAVRYTRWKLEGSQDGENYFSIADKSNADTDLPHDFILREHGMKCRYIKLTIAELPFNQTPCVSGLRVFGNADGNPPAPASGVAAEHISDLDMVVSWQPDGANHIVMWGHAPEKLYHSYMVFGKNSQKIGALMKDEPVYYRVDTFNECGVAQGETFKL